MITKPSPNRAALNYSNNEMPMATPRKKNSAARKKAAAKRSPASNRTAGKRPSASAKSTPRKPSPRERLTTVKPSGAKDDSFFDLVHEIARQIPHGRVTSYGAIAACLGTKLSARMVGWAMNAAHLAKPPIPAHRVVNHAGLLTGRHHFKPPEKMQQLLEKEGVAVINDKVVDFARLFWDPAKEL
jgi:methylated-DNA-protein-cysteine methyltransferase related protein